MKSKHYIFLFIIILNNAKALFYYSNEKVSWFVFSQRERYLCNVIEDYANRICFLILFYFITFVRIDHKMKQVSLFLLILNVLDIIHLGLFDLQYLIFLKSAWAGIMFYICSKLKVL